MIAITRTDGGVSIASNDVAAAVWIKAHPELYVSHAEISDVPKDRTFRAAWKHSGGKVGHDIIKCRELTKMRLRVERAPKLAALDAEFMRALEEGKPTTDIVAQKQVLRDITNQVDSVSDLEALKAIKA